MRNVVYRFVVKGSEVFRTSWYRDTDPPDVLQAKILDRLNQNRLYDIKVEVDPSLNVNMSGTIPGYRNVQRVLELPKQGFGLKSLTYEIVAASQGGRR